MFERPMYESLHAAGVSQRDTSGMMVTCKCWGKDECKYWAQSSQSTNCMYFRFGEFCDKVEGKN